MSPLYKRQFPKTNYGYPPPKKRGGGRDALRRTQKIVDEDKYVVDFDLERFFDMVSHSKLIKILSRGVKYGKV
ncbi:hypothetical protein DWZ28_08205 [Parabacteroides merdae]|nr:hypothetical protein PARMER_01149 [Parabacteroides merdae ATCC 43184]RHN18811.1 hypothetical protein DWZ28_08205 [Parabacteroides merdae]